jgi:hypothetical protein
MRWIALFLLMILPCNVYATIAAHPRIWMTSTKLTQLQSQFATDANYIAMKSKINVYMASPYGTAGADCTSVPDGFAYDLDIAWAMVWQVEGIARYGDCAIKMSKQAQVYFCPGGGFGNPGCYSSSNSYRSFVIHPVIIFDWVYSRLSSGDKTTFVSNLTSAFAYQQAHFQPCYNSTSEPNCTNGGEGVLGNIGMGWMASDCMIGYGTWGDNPSDSGQSNNQIAQCLQRYTNEFHPTYNSAGTLPSNYLTGAGLGIGGTSIEGMEYGPQTYEYALGLMLMLTTATGTDYFADNGTMTQDIILTTLYSTSPNSTSAFGCGPSDTSYFPFSFGDFQPPVGIMGDSFRPALGIASDYLGASNIYAQYANYWLNNIQVADQCSATKYWNRYFYNFMFNTTGKTATNWRAGTPIATDRKAGGMQQVLARSDWTANGSWVGYTAGSVLNDHTHSTVGGFTYWRKGEMLTQPDIYYTNSDYACGEHENNVMINSRSQVLDNFAAAGNPILNFFEGVATYTYVQSDAFKVYTGFAGYNTPTQVLRDFVYLKPDYIIIWDRIVPSPSATNKILIHGPGGATPASAGQAITISAGIARSQTTGGQWLYITPLAPTSPTFTVVDEATAYSCIGNGTSYSVGSNAFPEKRVEITSGTTDANMQYLTFVEGSDSATPIASEKLSNGNFVAVHIKNATDDKTIGFSSSSNGAVISLPVSYSFTAAGATDTHLIANLPASSTVNVTRSKSAGTVSVTLAASGGGTNFTSTANGVICFTSALASCASSSSSAPVITSANSTTFVVNKPGTFTVTTTGSPTPSLSESGSLPSSVTFVDNGDGTATLSGTALSAGSFPITITATNSAGSIPQSFTLTVSASAPAPATAIFAAVPLPVGIAPVISGIVPTQSYVTSQGCSQDGLSWNANCPVRVLCSGCSSSTLVTFDGTPITVASKTGELDLNIPLALLPVPTAITQHKISLSNPVGTIH